MSKFGDMFVAGRNKLEAFLEDEWIKLGPELETDALSAVRSGVVAARARGGTAGDMIVAARNAAVQILAADGKSIGSALLNEFVTQEMTSLPVAPPPVAGQPSA